MKSKSLKLFFFMLKIYILILFLSPFLGRALALGEKFEIYNAPQSLGMGSALTADTSGYTALYHNPAGLAAFTKKKTELTPIDLEGVIGTTALAQIYSAQSMGVYRLFGTLNKNPGKY